MKKTVLATALALTAAIPLTGTDHARAADNDPPKLFVLSSPAMESFGYVADKYVNNNPQNHNCSGENVSLPLNWANVPDGTKSFAITMLDPVPRAGLGFVHWVAYDIPADKKGLKEGEANSETAFGAGKNGAGKVGWAGPCPPPTDYPHPYTIELVATDIEPGTLKPGMTRDELLAALQGHVRGATTFIARYHKPAAGG